MNEVLAAGQETVVKKTLAFCDSYKLPCVSIGRACEQILKEDENVVCIETDKADTKESIRGLLEEKPELEGACTLILSWCDDSNSENCYEAIQLLRPAAVLSTFEIVLTRADKKSIFFQWLNGTESFEYQITGLTNDFTLVSDTRLMPGYLTIDTKNVCILWIQHKTLEKFPIERKDIICDVPQSTCVLQ